MRLSDLSMYAKYYIRRWRGTSTNKRILDVGSGHRPHEDSTHLLDLLPEDDSERGKPIKKLGRPLVLGTIEALPFQDKAFDYIYASQSTTSVIADTANSSEISIPRWMISTGSTKCSRTIATIRS